MVHIGDYVFGDDDRRSAYRNYFASSSRFLAVPLTVYLQAEFDPSKDVTDYHDLVKALPIHRDGR